VAERAGMLNIGIEGMMTVGALSGFIVAHWSGRPLDRFSAGASPARRSALVFG